MLHEATRPGAVARQLWRATLSATPVGRSGGLSVTIALHDCRATAPAQALILC